MGTLVGIGSVTLTDLNDVYFGDTAPSNPKNGALWWHTVEKKMYTYDNGSWLPQIVIGGRNLILNSGFLNGLTKWTSNGTTSVQTVDGKQCIQVTGTSNGFYQTPLDEKVGDKYTISFEAKSISTSSSVTIGFINQTNMSSTITLNNTWKKYSFTTTNALSATSQLFQVYANASTSSGFYITNIQVERGNIPTEYNPAIEDMQESVTTITTTLGNMANDNLIDVNERQTIKDKLTEILGYVLADTDTVLPTATTLEASQKGDYYRIIKSAQNSGITSSDATYGTKYSLVITRYGELKTYLDALTPKAWDTGVTNKDKNIDVTPKDTFRDKWLKYYLAVQDLASAIADRLKTNADNITIGATNYATDGDFRIALDKSLWASQYVGQTLEIVDISTETPPFTKALHIKNTSATNGGIFSPIIWTGNEANDMLNKEITIQYWLKYQNITQGTNTYNLGRFGELIIEGVNSSGVSVYNYVRLGTGNIYGGSYVSGTNMTWGKYVGTYKVTLPSGAVSIKSIAFKHGIEGCIGEFWTTGIKIEKGNRATDWSQSPYDIETRIANAEFKIQDSQIVSTVTTSSVYTSRQTTIDNNINVIKSATESGYITKNPIFSDWGGNDANYPTGTYHWSGTFYGKKDNTYNKNGGNSLRFQNTGTNDAGVNLAGGFFKTSIANSKYLIVEVDFYVVSGTDLSASGVLIDWGGMATYRTQFKLQDALNETISTGKWYSIKYAVKRPSDVLTGYTGMQGYIMANYSGLGTKTDKDIVFNRFAVREASAEEVKSYESDLKIKDMADDNKLTPVEKQTMRTELESIALEQATLVNKAIAYGVTTEKDNYLTAYNTLNNNMSSLLTDSQLKVTSDVVGSTVRNYFKDYYDKKAILERKLTESVTIGQRNLIFNSTFTKIDEATGVITDWTNISPQAIILTPEYDKPTSKILNITATGNTTNQYYSAYSNKFMASKGEAFTFSVDIRVSDFTAYNVKYPFIIEFFDTDGIRVEYDDVSLSDLNLSTMVNSQWYRVSCTYTVANEDVVTGRIRLCLYQNGDIDYREVKVEKGFIATDFTPAPEDTDAKISDLVVDMSNVKQQITSDKIISTVTNSKVFTDALGAKANLTGTNSLESAFLRISNVEQTSSSVDINFKSSGGQNKLRNSVGYANLDYWITVSGTVEAMQSTDLVDSGSCFVMKGGTIKQTVLVTPNQPYTLSTIVKKSNATGTGYMKIYDSSNTYTVNITARTYNYEQLSITIPQDKFVGNQLTVELNGGDATNNIWFTSTILNTGTYPFQWSHAKGEMYNTNITMNSNGIRVAQTGLQGAMAYTVMTPYKFAGYYSTTIQNGKIFVDESAGSPHEIFRMDGDTFVMKNATVKQGILMQSIKIIPVNTTDYNGWAFVGS